MADDTGGTGPLPRGKGPDPEFQNVVFQLTSAERNIAIAGVLIVVVNLLVGDVLLNDYVVRNSTWLIALACLGAIYFFYAGDRNPWHDWYPWIVEMGAWAIGLSGIIDFFRSFFDSAPSSGSRLFFQIVLWVAAALSTWGAVQIRTNR